MEFSRDFSETNSLHEFFGYLPTFGYKIKSKLVFKQNLSVTQCLFTTSMGPP